MQKISPFIWFDNNAEDAMNFYLSIFRDSKIVRVAHNQLVHPDLRVIAGSNPSAGRAGN